MPPSLSQANKVPPIESVYVDKGVPAADEDEEVQQRIEALRALLDGEPCCHELEEIIEIPGIPFDDEKRVQATKAFIQMLLTSGHETAKIPGEIEKVWPALKRLLIVRLVKEISKERKATTVCQRMQDGVIKACTHNPPCSYAEMEKKILNIGKTDTATHRRRDGSNAGDETREQLPGVPVCEGIPEPIEKRPNDLKAAAFQIALMGDPVKYILRQYQRLHPGDTGWGLLILMATATQHNLIAEGLFPKPSGDPGSGKTHATRAMLHLHPPEWIKSTTLSDKGPYYAPNRYDGMIFFSDDRETSEGQEEFMRRAYSDFQRRPRHTTLTRDLKGIEVEAPARSILYLTSVSDKFTEAMADRLIDTGMEDTDKQRNRVLKAQTRRVRDARPLLPVDEKILIAREILRDLMRQTFRVKIPFADRLKWTVPPGSREAAQFYDMIMAMAILRFRQRKTNEAGEILAVVEDFSQALELYKERGQSMHLSLIHI